MLTRNTEFFSYSLLCFLRVATRGCISITSGLLTPLSHTVIESPECEGGNSVNGTVVLICRYMSMAVVHDGLEEVLLALACSDGAVRYVFVNQQYVVISDYMFLSEITLLQLGGGLFRHQNYFSVILFFNPDFLLWERTGERLSCFGRIFTISGVCTVSPPVAWRTNVANGEAVI